MSNNKFKPGNKIICITNKYMHIQEGQRATVDKYITDGYFYIEDEIGSFEDDDFINVDIYKR